MVLFLATVEVIFINTVVTTGSVRITRARRTETISSDHNKISFISENQNNNSKEINNYEDWLKAQYGPYFSENFPMQYNLLWQRQH